MVLFLEVPRGLPANRGVCLLLTTPKGLSVLHRPIICCYWVECVIGGILTNEDFNALQNHGLYRCKKLIVGNMNSEKQAYDPQSQQICYGTKV